jgi:hypothetical protein
MLKIILYININILNILLAQTGGWAHTSLIFDSSPEKRGGEEKEKENW